MKHTISFTLPEERDDLRYAQNGAIFASILLELDNHLRAKLKYTELTDDEAKAYQETRDKLHQLLNDEAVSL